MDLDDEVVTSLRVEGYDISCVQSGVQNQRIPTGTTDVWRRGSIFCLAITISTCSLLRPILLYKSWS